MTNSLPVLELWFTALHEQVGIIVTSNNRHRLMNTLYKARADYQESSVLEGLSIVMSPSTDTELWIVHKTVKLNETDLARPDISIITPEA